MHKYCFLTLSKFGDQLERLLSTTLVAQPNLSLGDIYVVDDGLSETTKTRWNVNYISGEKPFSFARNFNKGVAALPKDRDVFYMGDDAYIMTTHGIDLLAKAAYADAAIGMTGPVVIGFTCNYYQTFGVLFNPTVRKALVGEMAYVETMMFIAVYIKREIIEKVGPIPESFTGYGYEDNYFTSKMIKAGYDWLLDPEVVAYHGWENFHSSASFLRSGHNIEEMSIHNRKIFQDLQKNDFEDNVS